MNTCSNEHPRGVAGLMHEADASSIETDML